MKIRNQFTAIGPEAIEMEQCHLRNITCITSKLYSKNFKRKLSNILTRIFCAIRDFFEGMTNVGYMVQLNIALAREEGDMLADGEMVVQEPHKIRFVRAGERLY